jgi:hypothetical protein
MMENFVCFFGFQEIFIQRNVPEVLVQLLKTDSGKCQEYACSTINSLAANKAAATEFCMRLHAVKPLLDMINNNALPNSAKVRSGFSSHLSHPFQVWKISLLNICDFLDLKKK